MQLSVQKHYIQFILTYVLLKYIISIISTLFKTVCFLGLGCYMSNRNWKGKSMPSITVLHCDLCVQVGRGSLIHLRTKAWSRAQKQPWPAGWPMTPALQSGTTSTLLSMSLLSTLSKCLLSFSLSLFLLHSALSHIQSLINTCLFLPFLSCVFITFSLIRLDLTVTCWAAVIHLIRENGWICKQSNNLDGDFN